MKRLFLLFSLCSSIGLQAAAAPAPDPVVQLVTSDGVRFKVPKNRYEPIQNLVDDIGNSSIIPVPYDSHHFNHADSLYSNPFYQLPVTYEELKRENVTSQGLLRTLNYLAAENYLEKLYVAWLNHPQNERAAVHDNAHASVIFKQMGIDTQDLHEDIKDKILSLNEEHTGAINNYRTRHHPLSIQTLIDTNRIPPLQTLDMGIVDYPLTLDLRNLSITDLDGLQNLRSTAQYLLLNNNQITTLPPRIFVGFPELIGIFLNRNRISSIRPRAFEGQNNLETLDLSNNQLGPLQPGTFQGLDQLVILSLPGNPLVTLQANTFRELGHLKSLSLNYTQLATLEANAFQGLRHLESLYLNGNQLVTFQGAFTGLPALKRLILYHNQPPFTFDQQLAISRECPHAHVAF